jgi:hypothetical protein
MFVPAPSFSRCRLALAALCLALPMAAPARAGTWQVSIVSGSGSATETPLAGSPTTRNLTSPTYVSPFFSGSVAYSYSETFRYQWTPDPGYTLLDDPPQEQEVTFSGSTYHPTFLLTSDALIYPGSASASVTMGDVPAEETLDSTPGASSTDPPVTTSTDTGEYVSKTVVFSGLTGTVTLQYNGSMDTGSTTAIQGQLRFDRSVQPRSERIKHTTDPMEPTAKIYTQGDTVLVKGEWKGLAGTAYHVLQRLRSPNDEVRDIWEHWDEIFITPNPADGNTTPFDGTDIELTQIRVQAGGPGRWTSRVTLMIKDPKSGDYKRPVAGHFRYFVVRN